MDSTKKDTVDIKKEVLKALPYIILITVIIIINKIFIFNTTIPSSSMESTLNIGDCLIGNRMAYSFKNPERGDIITFKAPDDDSLIYVKRVIGIAGDIVRIDNGKVYRNGELLNEDYIKDPMKEDEFSEIFEVPEGCVFVMGDNRNNSFDARFWNNHYVSTDKIISKLEIKYMDGLKNTLCFKIIK